MFSTILIIIIFLSLAAIAVILIRKLPKILAVNTKSPALKQASVKRQLLERRFQRHFKEGGKRVAIILKPILNDLAEKSKRFYQKLINLEEKYRHKALKASFKEEVVKEQKIERLLKKAQELVEKEDFDEAEKMYIAALTLEGKSISAYKGLGELYLLKKDYEHAKETFEFLLKIAQNDPYVFSGLGEIAALRGDLKVAEEDYLKSLEIDKGNIDTYLKLAEIYLNLEDNQKAFATVEQAVTLEPNNPRVLDFLIEISIIVKDKATAYKAYRQLKEVNPENGKLSEFRERINSL